MPRAGGFWALARSAITMAAMQATPSTATIRFITILRVISMGSGESTPGNALRQAGRPYMLLCAFARLARLNIAICRRHNRRRSITMTAATRRTTAALCATLVLATFTVLAQQSPGRWDTEKYAKLPQPAEEYTPIQVNDKLYLIGGNAAVLTPGARPTHPARVMVYDLANNSWTEKKNTPFFADHMSAATVNGKIYVFGGSVAMTQEAPSATLDTAWEYDPAGDSWKALAKLNGKRTAAAATEFGGKIYFIGGSTDTTGPDGRTQNGGLVVGTNEVYDPATNRWETKEPLPT